MLNKTIIPILLVFLVWLLTLSYIAAVGFSCDIGCPLNAGLKMKLGKYLIYLAPLLGGLYIYLTSKDLRFSVILSGIFYIRKTLR